MVCHKVYRRDAHWLRGRKGKSICPVDDDDDYTVPASAGYYLRPIRSRSTHFLQSSYVQLSLRDVLQVYWTRIKAKEGEYPDPPPMQFYSFSIFFFLGGVVIVGTLARTHHAKNLRS